MRAETHSFRRHPKPLMAPRVVMIIFNPTVGRRPLARQFGLDPQVLTQYLISAIRAASGNRVVYRIARTVELKEFPVFEDGRRYTAEAWSAAKANDTKALRVGSSYATFDYLSLKDDLPKYDEIWMWGAGYFGFYESRMIGEGAFWCNGPAIEMAGLPPRVVMGFNYERSYDMALHAFGHRVESIMEKADPDTFKQWTKAYGTVHTAPGQVGDYQYGEQTHEEYMCQWHRDLSPGWWRAIVHPRLVK